MTKAKETLTEIKIDGRYLDYRADYYDVDSDILNDIDEEELGLSETKIQVLNHRRHPKPL